MPYPAPGGEPAGTGGRLVRSAPGTLPVLSISARVTWATVRWGNLDRTRAATPATMPLAALVELIVPWPSGGAAEARSTPGAVSDTQERVLLNEAR